MAIAQNRSVLGANPLWSVDLCCQTISPGRPSMAIAAITSMICLVTADGMFYPFLEFESLRRNRRAWWLMLHSCEVRVY